jgi:hypothetical protein
MIRPMPDKPQFPNGQVDAQRLGNTEHEPIADLAVADRFAVLLPVRIRTCRQPFTRRRIFVSPSRNSSRDWNGTLAAYCHVTPVEQNQNEKQKDTVSGMGATKAVIGNCTPPTHSLFVSDIPRR